MVAAFFATILVSLQSLERYEHKSTVVTIERDHYYWNTTLPSFTICPATTRIDIGLFDEYCEEKGIVGQAKVEFHEFIESLANVTYGTFGSIKEYKSVDVICIQFKIVWGLKKLNIFIFLQKLKIKPEDYMMLIFNLTTDETRVDDGKVNAVRNSEQVRCEQILTEQGICYTCNSNLAQNLSAL